MTLNANKVGFKRGELFCVGALTAKDRTQCYNNPFALRAVITEADKINRLQQMINSHVWRYGKGIQTSATSCVALGGDLSFQPSRHVYVKEPLLERTEPWKKKR